MSRRAGLSCAALLLMAVFARAEGATVPGRKIKPLRPERAAAESDLEAPDTDVIDAPTAATMDYGGYASRSRFYASGGLLEYVSFGVYPSLNLGASAAIDGLVGDEKNVRVRAPTAQVKYRFFEGDEQLPALAAGFDGQGYRYNQADKRFNQRQRGFFLVASKEIGLSGVQIHPSFNISDFNSNAIFGSLPLTVDIQDTACLLAEWDNINNWSDSRVNLGLRAYLSPHIQIDFAVRSVGAGGHYSDGASKGPERVVQIKYSGNF